MSDLLTNLPKTTMSRSSLSKADSELSELTPLHDLVKFLECPVCQEISLPPIYNCEKGHIICNRCRTKVNKCALCRAPFTQSRNFPLESIVETSKFVCDYYQSGCDSILYGSELQSHKDFCQFRPLTCHWGRMDDCNYALINFTQYYEHLIKVHRMSSVDDKGPSSFTILQTLHETTVSKIKWLCKFKKFDNNIFLTRSLKHDSVFLWSLAIIGGEKEASKYAVKISIIHDTEPVPKFEMTVPVIPIRKSESEIQDSAHAMLTEGVLKYFCQTIETPEKEQKFQWRTHYEIIKLKDKDQDQDLKENDCPKIDSNNSQQSQCESQDKSEKNSCL